MENKCVFIGMDLGTFKTSIASSTGVRDVVASAVGWPKDQIARTMFGRDVVFGEALREQRLAARIVRPFEKGVLKYADASAAGVSAGKVALHKKAARLLVDHAVSLVQPPEGVPVYGVIGAPARATVENKSVLLEAAAGAFSAVMIVSEPFAVAFGMNRLTDTLVVDIGAGTIDICPICGLYPADEDQVTLPLGGDHVDEHLRERLKSMCPGVKLPMNLVRDIKERFSSVEEQTDKAIITLPVDGKPRQVDVTEVLREACETLVDPIVEGIREVVNRFDPEFRDRLLNNIILAGGGSQLRGLGHVIEESLQEYGGGRVRTVADPVYAGAIGALKLAMTMPVAGWERLARLPARRELMTETEAPEGMERRAA